MKKFRKWIALFCTGVMAASFLAGCGNGNGNTGEQVENGTKQENGASAENKEKSMGRYLEKDIVLPEEFLSMSTYPIPYLEKRNDGKLVIAEEAAGIYTSADNGETWESEGNPWRDLPKDIYLTGIAFSPDGAVAVKGSVVRVEEKNENSESEAVEKTEQKYYYIDSTGKRTEITCLDDLEWVFNIWFDRQGRLYATAPGGKFYRIDPKARTKKELFQTEGNLDFACFTEKHMVGFTSRAEVVVYDLEQEILAQTDKVLQDFVTENLVDGIGGYDYGHEIVATAGEQEDIIYFAFQGGLYRHVIGGTAIEQIIDGTTSSFGDPSKMLMGMVTLPDNEFAVMYKDGALLRYTYDPNVPTVPDKQLKVYSLTENYSMRQAVSLYQKAHQDVYIRYEIGMSGQDGVTREDAIRNLNTKIMSGEGPDILLLDGLPQHSYEEKGILADMSSLIDGLSGEEAVFPNIVKACKKDGKLYALPIRIQLPMLMGDAEIIQNIKDLGTLADAVEELRVKNPEGELLGFGGSMERLFYVLSVPSSAAWADEKGKINEAALEEFLTQAKRIWQAEIAGTDYEEEQRERSYSPGFSGEEGRYFAAAANQAIDIAMGERRLAAGKVYRVDFDYAVMTSIAEQHEELGIASWNGQVKDGFIPEGLAGVAASAAENELALSFYKLLFGRELQDMDLADGLAVNMASFDSFRENPRKGMAGEDERSSGGIGISNANEGGVTFSLDVLWPSAEEFQQLKDKISAASRIMVGDTTIEQAVYEVLPKVLDSTITPKEGVKEIVKKAAIYLAE